MSVLAVGSVALDGVETPAGSVDGVVGGSAVYFAAAATLLTPVRVVGVVGDDYPLDRLGFLAARGADLSEVERRPGPSFHWAGRYLDGMRRRETLDTRLGVFADFNPRVPEAFADSPVVFLGNIDPVLQLRVLEQAPGAQIAAADTMNYWIQRTRAALMEVVARLDILLVNDEEAEQLSGRRDLARAAEWIRRHGPSLVVVKRGESGATLYGDGWSVHCAAYPLASIVDPTGAGDAMAGGFLGFLAAFDDGATAARSALTSRSTLRRALAHGCAMGSFAVEAFSVDRFRNLDRALVDARVGELARTPAREPAIA